MKEENLERRKPYKALKNHTLTPPHLSKAHIGKACRDGQGEMYIFLFEPRKLFLMPDFFFPLQKIKRAICFYIDTEGRGGLLLVLGLVEAADPQRCPYLQGKHPTQGPDNPNCRTRQVSGEDFF